MEESVAAPAAGSRTGIASQRGGERPRLLAAGWRVRDWPAAWLLILPVLILFGITVVFPLIDTIRLSFFDIKGLGKPKYVGIGNYVKLFVDPAFRNTLVTTALFTLGTTAISVGLGWFLAMLCAFAPRQTLPFRVMIFAAFGVSEAVAGYMWIGILRPDAGGLLNAVIGIFQPGFAQPWLGDPRTALWALIITASWGGVGLPLMLIRRGLLYPVVGVVLPSCVVAVPILDLSWLDFFPLLVAGTVAGGYGAILHHLTVEVGMRPVLIDINRSVSPQIEADVPALSLRWRLLTALPLINVITGFIVAVQALRLA